MKLDDLYSDLSITDPAAELTGSKRQATYADPREAVYRNTIASEASSPWGVVAQALAGYRLGRSGVDRQNQQQRLLDDAILKDQQFSQNVGRIMKEHEDKGYTDKHTRMVFGQMYAQSKDPRYLKIANMFSSADPKPANELKDATDALKNYDTAMEETQGLEYDPSSDPQRQAIVSAMSTALGKNYPSSSNVNKLSDLSSMASGATMPEAEPSSDIQPSKQSKLLAASPAKDGERNEAYLASLNPKWQDLIKGVADYDIDAKTRMGGFNKSKQAEILNAVKRYDPNFDMKEYPVRADFMKQLSRTQRGTVGGQRLALNTLISHIGQFQDEVDALKAGGLPPANAVINMARRLTGNNNITDYNLARLNVESEMETLLTGVGVTQEGLKQRLGSLGNNPSDKQLQNYVQRLLDTLTARGNAIEDHYRSVLKKEPGDDIYFPESRAVIERLRAHAPAEESRGGVIDNTGFEMIKHGGRTYRIPKDMVAEFKKDKGIK